MNYPLAKSVMDATFTLTDFFNIALYLAGVIALIILIAILIRAYQALGDIREIIKDNKDNIDQIMDQMPQVSRNISDISTELSHASQAFRPSVNNIAESATEVTQTVKENSTINKKVASVYNTASQVGKIYSSLKPDKNRPITINIDKDFKNKKVENDDD